MRNKEVRVSDVAEVLNGKTPSKNEQRSHGYPVLKIRDVDSRGCFTGKYTGYIDPELAKKYAKKKLIGGESLILNAAHSATHVASKTFYTCKEVEGAIATGEWLIIRWDTKKIDSRYGHYWINLPETRFKINQLVNGIHLYPKDVKLMKFPFPPFPEQKRIADILDKAEAIRDKRKKSIAKLDELLQSVFHDMFGDLLASSDWCQVKVEALALPVKGSIRTGPFGSQLLHSEFVDDGIAVLGIDNAVNNTFRWGERRYITVEKYKKLKKYTVKPGDVLITIMGTCGRCAIVPDDIPLAINTKHLCSITLNKEICLPEYLHSCFLMHKEVLKQLGISQKGALMPGLNMQIIKNLKVPLPPISLQEKYKKRVSRILELRRIHEKSDELSRNSFFSLQQRAFAGEL